MEQRVLLKTINFSICSLGWRDIIKGCVSWGIEKTEAGFTGGRTRLVEPLLKKDRQMQSRG